MFTNQNENQRRSEQVRENAHAVHFREKNFPLCSSLTFDCLSFFSEMKKIKTAFVNVSVCTFTVRENQSCVFHEWISNCSGYFKSTNKSLHTFVYRNDMYENNTNYIYTHTHTKQASRISNRLRDEWAV